MMRHETQEWCGVTERNEQTADMYARNEKKNCSCSFILIRIDTILSKNIWNNFQNLLFKKLLTQSGNQRDIFWRHTLVAQNRRVSVRLHQCLHTQNLVDMFFPERFIKNQNWAYLWINSLTFYIVCFCRMASWGLSKYTETKLQTIYFYLK